MSEPFLAEIRIFPYSFAPRGWAYCNGQIMPISQNSVLFSLIGTTYGGDGRTTFALPDLQARVPMHPGTGPGLTPRQLGETGGTTTVTLDTSEIPPHNHDVTVQAAMGTSDDPTGLLVGGFRGNKLYDVTPDPATYVPMNPAALAPSGGSQGHENIQPALGINFCIAVDGLYPSRN